MDQLFLDRAVIEQRAVTIIDFQICRDLFLLCQSSAYADVSSLIQNILVTNKNHFICFHMAGHICAFVFVRDGVWFSLWSCLSRLHDHQRDHLMSLVPVVENYLPTSCALIFSRPSIVKSWTCQVFCKCVCVCVPSSCAMQCFARISAAPDWDSD